MHRPRLRVTHLGAILALGACAPYPYDYSGESTSSADRSASSASASRAPQSPTTGGEFQDYSVSGMFHGRHGSFMQNHKAFREDLRVSYYGMFESAIKGEPGHFDVTELSLDFAHDFPVDPDTFVTLGAEGGNRRYDFSPTVPVDDRHEDVGWAGLRVGVGHFLSEDFLVSGLFEPGLYSDFEGTLTSDDWQFYGDVLGTWRAADSFYLKIGAYVSNDFEDAEVLPLFGVSWMPHEQWRLEVLLPRKAELSWLPTAATILAGGVEIEGDEFALRAPASLAKQRTTVEIQEIRLYGGLTYRFDDMFSVFARTGAVLAGDHEWGATTGNTEGTLEPTFFLEGGLGIEF